MKFLGTRIVTGTGLTPYCIADVISDGAILPHSVNVDEYIESLLKKIDDLQQLTANANEGAKLMHSLATGGESELLQAWDLPDGSKHIAAQKTTSGIDWDSLEYREAAKAGEEFDMSKIEEQEF